MVRRATARGKFGREDKSAQMYSAFEWRLVLLARMRCARIGPYKSHGRLRPLSVPGCRHAVVTVLSSLLPCADLGGELIRCRSAGKWERRRRSFPRWLGWRGCRSIVVAARQNRPGDAGELVGHGHHDDVRVSPGVQSIQTGTERRTVPFGAEHGAPCAMDQHLAQVDVAALTDAEQPGLAACSALR